MTTTTEVPTEVDPATTEPIEVEGADTSTEVIADGATDSVEVEQEPAGPVLDLDEFGDYMVPVTIDGETELVPLSEMPAGYSRQADYTRKTQQLAEDRRGLTQAAAIAQGLMEDPERTIEVLRNVYLEAEEAAAEAADIDPDDPYAGRIAALEAQIEAQRQAEAMAELNATLDRVADQYQVDPEQVAFEAVRRNTQDLELVAQSLAFQAMQQGQERQSQAKRAQTIESKRGAAVVHGGGTNPASSVGPATFTSYEDAGKAALAQLGFA